MKIVRKIVFWCHLAVGALVASVVVVMSATGVLLTYQKQIQSWTDTHGLAASAPTPNAPRLSADSLLARVQVATGTTPTAILVRADADAPVEVTLGRDRKAFVNAYTGTVLGEGSSGMRDFFRSVTAWHRTIGATGNRRALGKSITGLANAGFFFIVVSGLFLWWPRTWTRARLRNIATFRRGTSGKARDFNWHNTVGVWSFVPLVAIVGSGVVMSYPWANALVYRVVGEQVPQQNAAQGGEGRGGGRGGPAGRGREGEGSRGRGRADSAVAATKVANASKITTPPSAQLTPGLTLDSALAIGAHKMPDWRSISIQLPSAAAKTMTASLDGGTGGQPQLRGSLVIDRATGTISRWEPFSSQTPGRRLRSILRFAHTGEVLGITGQTIAGLVSLGSLLLAWTGIALALRRFVTWRRRVTRPAGAPRRVRVPELDPVS